MRQWPKYPKKVPKPAAEQELATVRGGVTEKCSSVGKELCKRLDTFEALHVRCVPSFAVRIQNQYLLNL